MMQLNDQCFNVKFSSGIKCSLITMLIVMCSACSQTPTSSGIGVERIKQTNAFEQYLKVDNEEMAEMLSLSEVTSKRVNGFLEVNTLLMSRSDKTQKLQYQYTWFDDQGFIVEANKSAWKPLSLHGGQAKYLNAIAPMPHVSTFSIYVRGVHSKAYEFE